MMDAELCLAEHYVFRELPFCGVLLDTRQSRVYRLSTRASAVLRTALQGESAVGPFSSLITDEDTTGVELARQQVVSSLLKQGVLYRGGDSGARSSGA